MAISAAKLAANQRNAHQSTGPRTDAGKARSRLNAFQHGLAGKGDVVGPGDDAALIEQRTAEFGRDLGVAGSVNQYLARRAAILSVRLDRCANHDRATVAANMARARDDFDDQRLEPLNEWIDQLEAGTNDPGAVLDALECSLDGVLFLIGSWSEARAAILHADPAAIERACSWLGIADAIDPAALLQRVDAELARLRAALVGQGETLDEIADERNRAGQRASFDPSPDAERARRYEAAAQRGFFQTLRTISQLQPGQAGQPGSNRTNPTPAPQPASPPRPTNPPAPQPPPRPATGPTPPVGSFRAGSDLPPSDQSAPLDPAVGLRPPAAPPTPNRPNRS